MSTQPTVQEILEYFPVEGMPVEQLKALTMSTEEFRTTTGLSRLQLIEKAFSTANVAYEKPQIGRLTAAINAAISQAQAAGIVEIALQVEIPMPGEQKKEYDPYAEIDEATSSAVVQEYDLHNVAVYARIIKAFGPDARLRTILREALKKKGLTQVKNPWLKTVLVNWMNINPAAGGQLKLPRNLDMGLEQDTLITILSESTREENWIAFLSALQDSDTDVVLREATKYYIQQQKAEAAKQTGATVVTGVDDVKDPYSIKQDTVSSLVAIHTLIQQGIFEETIQMIALEQAYVILTALKDPGVIRSLGVAVSPEEETSALRAFLNAPGNPYPEVVAALRFTSAAGKALAKLATFDPQADFVAYLLELGKEGRDYIDALAKFTAYSPQKPAATSYMTMRQAAASLQAMVRVTVTMGGTTLTAEVKTNFQREGKFYLKYSTKNVDRKEVSDIFALLYGDSPTICRALDEAGFNRASLVWTGAAKNVWHGIMNPNQQFTKERFEALVNNAYEDMPDNELLKAVLEAYFEWK